MKISLFRFIDKIVGTVLCAVLGMSRFFPHTTVDPENILVIKLWAVGESVLTLPMIACLKKTHPKSTITVLCRERNKAVYEGQKNIDAVLLFEPPFFLQLLQKYHSFDLGIDCEPYMNCSALLAWWLGKTRLGFDHGIRAQLYTHKLHYNDQQHVVTTYAQLLSTLNISCTPQKLEELSYSRQAHENIKKLLRTHGILKQTRLVGICQSVAESGLWRRWPTERYSQLADLLIKQHNTTILLIGGKDTFDNNETIRAHCTNKTRIINLGGKTTLEELYALMKELTLFISNDTGPMHIAAAQGTPTIGLFGPNLPTRFAPFGKGNTALYEKTPCSPCINVHKGSFPDCFNPEKGLCMKQISVEQVYAASSQLFNRIKQ